MVTWLELRDRRAPETPTVRFFNSHFDHRGRTARYESARLVRRRLADIPGSEPIILTGDFNAGEGSAPHRALFARNDEGSPLLIDTYRAVHRQRSSGEATFSGFDAERRKGERIDWIAVTDHFSVLSADIDHSSRNGRSPSDHFPVTAVLQYDD